MLIVVKVCIEIAKAVIVELMAGRLTSWFKRKRKTKE